jgi:hypothetical protein
MHRRWTAIGVALAALMSSAATGPRACAAPVDFAHDVLPLLAQHCAKCHANGRYEADLSLDTREAVLDSGIVEPGSSADSELMNRITSDDPDYRMPPEGDPLTAAEVDVLRRWVEEGVAWEEGFTFKQSVYEAPLKPRRPELPPAEQGVENPIDVIVGAYWRDHGVEPTPLASDAGFYRRASLDLTGLLPSHDELAAFVADGDPHKREALVDRLLADRVAYADHWMTFWNDLLRNDYAGTGYIDGGRKQITAWLYQSLLDNMPYDEFVRELVAPRPESEGFAKGIVWRGQVNASQRPELQFSQNVGQVFLGINLKCASCHDSFVDNWKLADAYGLAAITSSEPLELHRCDKPTGEMATAKFLFPELGEIDPTAPREARLEQLAALMTHPQNGRLTRTIVNRLWQRLMGRGIVHPVDSMGTAPWSDDLLDYLAVNLSDANYNLKATLRLIATSQAYGRETAAWDEGGSVEDFIFAGPSPKRMTAEQFCDALAAVTGVAPEATDDDKIFVKLAADEAAEDHTPRSFVRSSLVEGTLLMRTLGRPNREQVVTTRPSELTTLEALELSNGQPLAELLFRGAEELLKSHRGVSAEAICREAFAAALSREPTDDELARLEEMTGDSPTADSLADALWCIVMLPEFQIVR